MVDVTTRELSASEKQGSVVLSCCALGRLSRGGHPRGPAGSGGCTLIPDAHLFTVIDRAIQAELSRLPKGSRFEINEKRRVT
jgi:hypothetical protein